MSAFYAAVGRLVEHLINEHGRWPFLFTDEELLVADLLRVHADDKVLAAKASRSVSETELEWLRRTGGRLDMRRPVSVLDAVRLDEETKHKAKVVD